MATAGWLAGWPGQARLWVGERFDAAMCGFALPDIDTSLGVSVSTAYGAVFSGLGGGTDCQLVPF